MRLGRRSQRRNHTGGSAERHRRHVDISEESRAGYDPRRHATALPRIAQWWRFPGCSSFRHRGIRGSRSPSRSFVQATAKDMPPFLRPSGPKEPVTAEVRTDHRRPRYRLVCREQDSQVRRHIERRAPRVSSHEAQSCVPAGYPAGRGCRTPAIALRARSRRP
jgi:hypothetical protein